MTRHISLPSLDGPVDVNMMRVVIILTENDGGKEHLNASIIYDAAGDEKKFPKLWLVLE